MTGPALATAGLAALAAAIGIVRLLLWQTRAEPKAPAWRLALLVLLQPVAALFLYLTLDPPSRAVGGGTLAVATGGTGRAAAALAEGRLVALPEAPAGVNGERVPDLATALRRYPDSARLVVLGEGLPPRDRQAAAGRSIAFTPPRPARSLVRLDAPGPTAPGAAFRVTGAAAQAPGGSAELLDPAGRRVDLVPLDRAGGFIVGGTARAAGTALLTLRLRDASGRTIEAAPVPLLTRAEPQPRLLILAGAPGPEVKYLRRWASDAGLAVDERLALGLGLSLGAALPLTGDVLRRFDLAVVDERAFRANRGALLAAVRRGLGLLVRADCPSAAGLREIGLGLSGRPEVRSVRLSAVPGGEAVRGPGTADAPSRLLGNAPAVVTRCAARFDRGAIPLVRDLSGDAVAAWRPLVRGRIGLSGVLDSFALATAGRGDAHADYWSTIAGTLARAVTRTGPEVTGSVWAGERVSLCRLADGATLDGGQLAIDPATGARRCAAAWPTAGWHSVRSGGVESQFHAMPPMALPGVRRAEAAAATLALSGADAAADPGKEGSVQGPSWPWFVALLGAFGLLWWLERRPRGSPAPR